MRRNREEIHEYLEVRRKRLEVVHTTRTPSGQTLDWIARESQVAGGKLATPPPDARFHIPEGERRIQATRFELAQSGVERGPEGTVPVFRQDVSLISGHQTLQQHLSKYGGRIRRQIRLDNGFMLFDPDDGGVHHYTFTSQSKLCFGGEGNISVHDPYTSNAGNFSLMQIGLANDDTGKRQTVEGGWQEYRDHYGDWVPHFFVYYTTNGYSKDADNQGGYNQDVDGWVQYDDVIYPAATFTNVSVAGNPNAQFILPIKYQWYNGNWWFRCLGRWVGYYPGSLYMGNQSVFSTLGDHASNLAFWGEIADVDDPTATTMGSGWWAEDRWPWSAFQNNLMLQTDRGGTLEAYDGGSGWASDPDLWDVETHMNSGSNWGSYFWMGGPGA
jgi:hypothetical protein